MGEAKHLDVVPQKTAMVKEIIASTWGAVTLPSPDDLDSEPFEADAVIANPPVFGHIHVCEALGIPLHIMFPQVKENQMRDEFTFLKVIGQSCLPLDYHVSCFLSRGITEPETIHTRSWE